METTDGVNPWKLVAPRMLSAEDSLMFICGKVDADDLLERYRDEFQHVRQIRLAIDHAGANALLEELEERQRRAQEEAIELARTAPERSGFREDAELLTEIVRIKPWLPRRLRQVHELCIERGFTLAQCARALGIGKETVRTHLRRLRAQVPAAWCVQ